MSSRELESGSGPRKHARREQAVRHLGGGVLVLIVLTWPGLMFVQSYFWPGPKDRVPGLLFHLGGSAVEQDRPVREGLERLKAVRPDEVFYIFRRRVRIVTVKPGESVCDKEAFACTLHSGVIQVKREAAGSSGMYAARIAHEVVHVQHGDLAHPSARHTFWRHLFRGDEENEAHAAGVWVECVLERHLDLCEVLNLAGRYAFPADVPLFGVAYWVWRWRRSVKRGADSTF